MNSKFIWLLGCLSLSLAKNAQQNTEKLFYFYHRDCLGVELLSSHFACLLFSKEKSIQKFMKLSLTVSWNPRLTFKSAVKMLACLIDLSWYFHKKEITGDNFASPLTYWNLTAMACWVYLTRPRKISIRINLSGKVFGQMSLTRLKSESDNGLKASQKWAANPTSSLAIQPKIVIRW